MKELKKPKKKRVVFEKVSINAFNETPDGRYSQYDYYGRGPRDDSYARGGDIDNSDDILF